MNLIIFLPIKIYHALEYKSAGSFEYNIFSLNWNFNAKTRLLPLLYWSRLIHQIHINLKNGWKMNQPHLFIFFSSFLLFYFSFVNHPSEYFNTLIVNWIWYFIFLSVHNNNTTWCATYSRTQHSIILTDIKMKYFVCITYTHH